MSLIVPTEYQQRVMLIPEDFDIAMLGGRGGGKSYGLAFLALQHVAQYGKDAAVLYVRRSHGELMEWIKTARDLFSAAFPESSFNAHKGVFSFGSGATVEANQLETLAQSWGKFQGRSFTLILVDEAGLWPDVNDVVDRLRSNLRGPAHMKTRMALAGNPGNVGHLSLVSRFVNGSAAWTPHVDQQTGLKFIRAPSTYRDNDRIDRAAYAEQLRIASGGDPARLRAWADGEFSDAVSDIFFAGALGEHNRFDADTFDRVPHGATPLIAVDFGGRAPTAAYLGARLRRPLQMPDGRILPADSLLVLDEWCNAVDGRPNDGDGRDVYEQAEAIGRLAERWNVAARGVIDDSAYNRHGGRERSSIASMFADVGVRLQRAHKTRRLDSLERTRVMFAAALESPMTRPTLLVSDRCTYFWSTVPHLVCDAKNVSEIADGSPDHGLDAVRYLLSGFDVGRVVQRSWNDAAPPRGRGFDPVRHFDPERMGEVRV